MDLREILYYNQYATTDSKFVRSITIIGENPDVDTATTPETVWEVGGVITRPTAATVVTVVSSHTSDDFGNVGANTVLIEGLDSNYKEIYETVNLDGINPVQTTQQFYRINFFRVVYSGSVQTNVGDIDATVNGNIISRIGAGESLAHTALYTVPANHNLFLTNFSYGVIRSTGASFATFSTKVYVPSINTITNSAYVVVDGSQVVSVSNEFSMARIPEKSDIWYTVDSVSANNTDAVVSVRGLLVNNAYLTNIKGY